MASAFLKIPDVRCESSDPQHLGWIEALSFGHHRHGTNEVWITKTADSTSALLFQMAQDGRSFEGEIDAVDAAYRVRWEADPAALRCPDGESGADVARRARAFLEDLLAWAAPATEGQQIVLTVAHSSFNRVLLCVAMGVPVRDYRRRFAQGQGNLTVIRWPSGAHVDDGRLLVANDTSHLAAPGQSPWELAPGA